MIHIRAIFAFSGSPFSGRDGWAILWYTAIVWLFFWGTLTLGLSISSDLGLSWSDLAKKQAVENCSCSYVLCGCSPEPSNVTELCCIRVPPFTRFQFLRGMQQRAWILPNVNYDIILQKLYDIWHLILYFVMWCRLWLPPQRWTLSLPLSLSLYISTVITDGADWIDRWLG